MSEQMKIGLAVFGDPHVVAGAGIADAALGAMNQSNTAGGAQTAATALGTLGPQFQNNLPTDSVQLSEQARLTLNNIPAGNGTTTVGSVTLGLPERSYTINGNGNIVGPEGGVIGNYNTGSGEIAIPNGSLHYGDGHVVLVNDNGTTANIMGTTFGQPGMMGVVLGGLSPDQASQLTNAPLP